MIKKPAVLDSMLEETKEEIKKLKYEIKQLEKLVKELKEWSNTQR